MNAQRADPRPPSQEVLDLLLRARELLDGEGTRADQFGRVAVHLIDCVIDVSKLLAEDPDLDAARVALGSARSAVVAATCAVRDAHGRGKGPGAPGPPRRPAQHAMVPHRPGGASGHAR